MRNDVESFFRWRANASAHAALKRKVRATTLIRGSIDRKLCPRVALLRVATADFVRYRTFGRTGWQVSELGYGMWGMAGWAGSDDAESIRSLQLAVDSGCNFFDTAWAYGDGHSERLLAKLVRANP